jgi:excisionase family DNA binding protein
VDRDRPFAEDPYQGLPPLLTADEVADYLKVKRRTVYDWVGQGILPAQTVGRRLLRFRRQDVLQFPSDPDGTRDL